MRVTFGGLLLAALLASRLVAQSPPPASAPGKLLELKLPEFISSPIRPTAELDASAFFAKSLVVDPANALSGETRSPAQLEALLATYIGTWRGESIWYSLSTHQAIHLPTEMIYRSKKQDGHNVLDCTITYQNNGASMTAVSRLWIENGHIFSETIQGGLTQKYVAQSRGPSLAWRTFGSMETLFDFAEVETLRLTVNGGTISSYGYEAQHRAPGVNNVVIETTELKLVK